MENEVYKLSCEAFTEALASSAPAPGGGGACALSGAMAASLCAMSAKLSLGKKKYADFEELIRHVDEKAEKLRKRFIELTELDRLGFLPLQRAYSLPKDTPERAKILREASLEACRAPMEMLVLCGETAETLSMAADINNPMLISDVGCGAALCRAAMQAAALNVLINTRGLKGDEEAERLTAEVRTVLEEYLPELEKMCSGILERLDEDGSYT